jgi:hypothetical protein
MANGSVVRIAGNLSPGYVEGSGTKSAFSFPYALATSSDGTFAIVIETNGHRVRMLNLTGGTVISSLVAGSTTGASGAGNGVGSSASFFNPQVVVISSDMTFAIVVDRGNHLLRKSQLQCLPALVSFLFYVLLSSWNCVLELL